MAKKHILIICGEASGDLHAAGLAKEIKNLNPEIKISGVGGTLLRQSAAEIYCDIKDLAVFGFFDALKKLTHFLSLQKLILRKIKEGRPDAIILVDFSGFNLRLAKKINPSTSLRIDGERSRTINKTIPVIYYISPQVWASRAGRVKTIKRHISKILVLFKFEQEFYKKYAIEADFVGHPLLDTVKPTLAKPEFLTEYKLSASKITIALLPGSRRQEVKNILPVMLKASCLIRDKIKEVQFVIAKSSQVDWGIYCSKIKDLNLDLKIIEDKTYDCLNIADFCLVCSGTATLEAAIMQKPFVVIYKTSVFNYLLYRPQVRLPFIGMVNIVVQKKIIPEFIQWQARPQNIAEEVLKTLQNPSQMQQIRDNLAQVKALLGNPGASQRAAKIILELLNSHCCSNTLINRRMVKEKKLN
jgi:lipid-A-disaccharide synthase